MKRLIVMLALTGVLLFTGASMVLAAPGGVTDPDILKLLAEVRQATKKYHNVAAALADGYTDEPFGPPPIPCEPEMGIHYVNLDLAALPPNELAPPILLYEPTKAGLKLAGVEYFAPAIGTLETGPYTGPRSRHALPL
ncbi:MAG: hypothetical protein HYX96_00625 [Chloroflexi bacterium]|nr:hypothetical protein [Chloroflexota bacterium]